MEQQQVPQQQPLSPHHIIQVGTGFWPSKVLLVAVKLQLFTHLAARPQQTAAEIKTALGFECMDRYVYDFLDTLTALGFLRREGGVLESGRYSNAPETNQFLDKAKPQSYIGGMLELMDKIMYGTWGHLEDSLHTGKQVREYQTDDLFKALYASPEKLREFANGMTGFQRINFDVFAKTFDFSRYRTLTDAGGSAAVLSISVASHNPHMRCTTFDLPPIAPIAQESIDKAGVGDRVKTAIGDFFNDPLPPADVVVMGNILHDWNLEKKRVLIKKAFDALPAEGAFVVIEDIIDDDRNKNAAGMMMSLNMLIHTDLGFNFTFTDFTAWVTEAGFKSTKLVPLDGPASAAVAYK